MKKENTLLSVRKIREFSTEWTTSGNVYSVKVESTTELSHEDISQFILINGKSAHVIIKLKNIYEYKNRKNNIQKNKIKEKS